MRPVWDLPDHAEFETLNVDGGTTNNSPIDCAPIELASLEPKMPNGHNPREPRRRLEPLADMAVDRAYRVGRALMDQNGGFWYGVAFDAAWVFA